MSEQYVYESSVHLTNGPDMHESGFIHTDLKPSNVMLRSGETREGPTFEEGLCPKVSIQNF